MLIPISYALLVVLAGIFANAAVAGAVTVIGAVVLGVGYYAMRGSGNQP